MNSLEVKKILKENAEKIIPIIEEILVSYVDDRNKKVIKYPILTGGKIVRPSLAITSCKMFGGKEEDVLYAAASLEILHNYSLIIDDMIDHSFLRRKKPTCWAKFGRSMAECVGVDYSASIFQGAIKSKKSVEVVDILTRTMKILINGEILDVLFEQSGRENEPFVEENRFERIEDEDYFEMANKKTSALIQASCEVGALIGGAKEKQIEFLRKYGFGFGLAYQIQDDILDIFGNENIFGKKKGQDIKEGKLGNIVILYAFRELSSSDKKKFLKIIRKENAEEKEIEEAIKLIEKTSSREKTSKLANDFIEEAKENLNYLPKNKWNEILRIISDFVIKREK
jgi:geranylgeranyl diphosphate synthase, type I